MDVTLAEAARQLGLSPDAVRKRVHRGTLASVRRGGRLYVVLPDAVPDGQEQPDGGRTPDRTQELIDQQRGEIARLVEQLAVKDEQLRQANVIIARLSERPLELPARVASVDTAAPAPLVDTPASVNQSQASTPPPAQVRRPWWAFWQ